MEAPCLAVRVAGDPAGDWARAVYERSILRTGTRVRLRQVIGRHREA